MQDPFAPRTPADAQTKHDVSVGPLRSAERDAVLAWLDAGLRGGRSGRLLSEYGSLLEDADTEYALVRVSGRPASHALLRSARLKARNRSLPLGLIGLVYTDPDYRGMGLASACIDAAATRLRERGALLALLWSEKRDFYARLGFHPAGVEHLLVVSPEVLGRARRAVGEAETATPAEPRDWDALEVLHAARATRIARAPGLLRSLARAPDCRVVVSRRAETPIAYAACGRGDDLQGVVHEWAGEPAGVLACLAALLEHAPELVLLADTVRTGVPRALSTEGAESFEGPLALARLLDARALWSLLVGESGALRDVGLRERGSAYGLQAGPLEKSLSAHEVLALLFGTPPEEALAPLGRDQRLALHRRLPAPLFAWGFDSI